MIDFLKLTVGLSFFVLTGHCVLSIFDRTGVFRSGLLVRLSVAYPIGVGIVTFQMFLYSLASIPFGILSIVLPWLLVGVLGVVFQKWFSLFGPGFSLSESLKFQRPTVLSRTELIIILVIVLQVLYVFIRSMTFPIVGYDAFVHWFGRANAFFVDQGVSPPTIGNDYPLLVPLAITWLYLCLSQVNDQLAKILFPCFFTALLLIFFYTLREFVSRSVALLFTAMLATIRELIRQAGGISLTWFDDYVGYADLILAFYLLAAGSFFCLYVKTNKRLYFFLSLISFGFGALTKNEGLTFLVIGALNLTVYLFYSRPRAEAFRLTLVSLVLIIYLILPWLLYKASLGMQNPWLSHLNLTTVIQQLDRLPVIFEYAAYYALSPTLFNLSWSIFLISIVLNRRSMTVPLYYLYAMIMLQWLSYVLIYMVTPLDLRGHLGTSISRLALQLTPLALFATALNTHELLKITMPLKRTTLDEPSS